MPSSTFLLLQGPQHCQAQDRDLLIGHERPEREPFGPRGVDFGRLHCGAGTAWSELPKEDGSVFDVGGTRSSSTWAWSPLLSRHRDLRGPLAQKTAPGSRPAKTASLEMVRYMENLLFEAESNMMRCWAGAQCAMAHGCPRWADLQATKNLKLTQDAVFGVSWRMKGRKPCAMDCAKGRVHWARLRFCLVIGACCCRPPPVRTSS